MLCSRGAAGPLPVPAHLPGVAVGRTPYGLQEPVDAHPLRHLQLLSGELIDLFVYLFVDMLACLSCYVLISSFILFIHSISSGVSHLVFFFLSAIHRTKKINVLIPCSLLSLIESLVLSLISPVP